MLTRSPALHATDDATDARADPPAVPLGHGRAALGLRSAVTPWRLMALVVGAALLLLQAVKPFVDVDLYWHVLVGQQILSGQSVDAAGGSFAYTLPENRWTTTQWLSEVVLAIVHDRAGWAGIAALRIAACAAFAVSLWAMLSRGQRTPWSAVVFATTLLICSTAFQERPLLASLLLTVWLAGVCARALADRVQPHPATLLIMTAFWANLHGQWVVVPGCLGLLALGRTLEWWSRREEAAFPVRAWVLVVVAAAAGTMTPVGPRLLLAPFEFRGAAAQILEWRPTSLDAGDTVGFALVVAVIVACWARRSEPVPATEIVFVLGLCLFAAIAVRNVVPAATLLAPLAVGRLQAAVPRDDAVDSRREQSVLAGIACGLVALSLLLLGVRFADLQHVPDSTPVDLARQLAAQPGEQYVVNDYNASGALLYWGGQRTRVAVDGRADRYGGSYLASYQDMMNMRRGWQQTFDELRPNAVLVERKLPLGPELVRRGWAVLGEDANFVLLQAPGGRRSGA